jgi:hypothetical protein
MGVESLNLPETRPRIAELQDRVNSLILEYDGDVGFLEVLGMLDFLKSTITARQRENIIDD